jgi:hypothetical protein
MRRAAQQGQRGNNECSSHVPCRDFLARHRSRRSRDHHEMPPDLFGIKWTIETGAVMRKLSIFPALVFALVTSVTTTVVAMTVQSETAAAEAAH